MRSRFDLNVEQIMTVRVAQVDTSATLGQIRSLMDARGLHKLLLVDGTEPQGLLEDWLVDRLKEKLGPDVAVGQALDQFKIKAAPVKLVEEGALVEDVKSYLSKYAAVIVGGKDPSKLAGIVTASDLEKLW